MNLHEIKSAIENGQAVKWQNDGYNVIKDGNGQYLIEFEANRHSIGLTHADGQTLNGCEADFYIKEMRQSLPVSMAINDGQAERWQSKNMTATAANMAINGQFFINAKLDAEKLELCAGLIDDMLMHSIVEDHLRPVLQDMTARGNGRITDNEAAEYIMQCLLICLDNLISGQ